MLHERRRRRTRTRKKTCNDQPACFVDDRFGMISLVMMKRFSSLRKLISRLLLFWLYHWDWHRNDREKEKCRDSDSRRRRRRSRGKISPKKDLIVFFNFLSFSLSLSLAVSQRYDRYSLEQIRRAKPDTKVFLICAKTHSKSPLDCRSSHLSSQIKKWTPLEMINQICTFVDSLIPMKI